MPRPITPEEAILLDFLLTHPDKAIRHLQDCWICRGPIEALGPRAAAEMGELVQCAWMVRSMARHKKVVDVLCYRNPELAEQVFVQLLKRVVRQCG